MFTVAFWIRWKEQSICKQYFKKIFRVLERKRSWAHGKAVHSLGPMWHAIVNWNGKVVMLAIRMLWSGICLKAISLWSQVRRIITGFAILRCLSKILLGRLCFCVWWHWCIGVCGIVNKIMKDKKMTAITKGLVYVFCLPHPGDSVVLKNHICEEELGEQKFGRWRQESDPWALERWRYSN